MDNIKSGYSSYNNYQETNCNLEKDSKPISSWNPFSSNFQELQFSILSSSTDVEEKISWNPFSKHSNFQEIQFGALGKSSSNIDSSKVTFEGSALKIFAKFPIQESSSVNPIMQTEQKSVQTSGENGFSFFTWKENAEKIANLPILNDPIKSDKTSLIPEKKLSIGKENVKSLPGSKLNPEAASFNPNVKNPKLPGSKLNPEAASFNPNANPIMVPEQEELQTIEGMLNLNKLALQVFDKKKKFGFEKKVEPDVVKNKSLGLAHVWERHAFDTKEEGVSKFSKFLSIEKIDALIRTALLRSQEVSYLEEGGIVVKATMDHPIGFTNRGKSTSTLLVVLNLDHTLKTAYPIKTPKKVDKKNN